jgi:hypothetical protein
MPKRVLDFDALWASDKLASCAEWAQAEYAWLYGLADASGSFELTNIRVIWGRVAAIRKNLTIERLEQVFQEFIARGLLFTWEQNGKRYGHWTGSDVPGRLPPPSWRARLERLAPPLPRGELAAYLSQFGARGVQVQPEQGLAVTAPQSSREIQNGPAQSPISSPQTAAKAAEQCFKAGIEVAQAQDLDLGLDLNLKKGREETSVCPAASPKAEFAKAAEESDQLEYGPEKLLEIYERERGGLPPAEPLTPERHRKCMLLLATGVTPDEFRAAVRRAAATPFLAGHGDRGWRANFDWLIVSDANVRKVLAGFYDSFRANAPELQSSTACGIVQTAASGNHTARGNVSSLGGPVARGRGVPELYAGAGPRAADCGMRVKPAALERSRARDAARSALRETGSTPVKGLSRERPVEVAPEEAKSEATALEARKQRVSA